MKKIFLSAALALTGFSAMAQAPISATGNEWLIQECRRLYSDKEYPAMLTVANKIESIRMSKQEKQEHDYLIATATFHIVRVVRAKHCWNWVLSVFPCRLLPKFFGIR